MYRNVFNMAIWEALQACVFQGDSRWMLGFTCLLTIESRVALWTLLSSNLSQSHFTVFYHSKWKSKWIKMRKSKSMWPKNILVSLKALLSAFCCIFVWITRVYTTVQKLGWQQSDSTFTDIYTEFYFKLMLSIHQRILIKCNCSQLKQLFSTLIIIRKVSLPPNRHIRMIS